MIPAQSVFWRISSNVEHIASPKSPMKMATNPSELGFPIKLVKNTAQVYEMKPLANQFATHSHVGMFGRIMRDITAPIKANAAAFRSGFSVKLAIIHLQKTLRAQTVGWIFQQKPDAAARGTAGGKVI
jgi:hypothetical protein